MKVKFEVKNGKLRFFIFSYYYLSIMLNIRRHHQRSVKKTFQQMAPLNNANFKVSPLVALRRVRITAIAVLLVYKCDTSQEVKPTTHGLNLWFFYINICCFINKVGVGLSDHNQ